MALAPGDDEALLRRAFEVARRSRAIIPSVRCWRALTARYCASSATVIPPKAGT
jgi:hypothetical protein